MFGSKKGQKTHLKAPSTFALFSVTARTIIHHNIVRTYTRHAIENEHVCIHDRIDAHFLLAISALAKKVLEHTHGILGDVFFLLLFVFVVVRDETIDEIECREESARGERRERKRDGSFSESDRGGTN